MCIRYGASASRGRTNFSVLYAWRIILERVSMSRTSTSSISTRALFQFVPHIVGQLLDLICLANDRNRERVAVCLVHFGLEIDGKRKQPGAFIGNLLSALGARRIEILLRRVLVTPPRLGTRGGCLTGGRGQGHLFATLSIPGCIGILGNSGHGRHDGDAGTG